MLKHILCFSFISLPFFFFNEEINLIFFLFHSKTSYFTGRYKEYNVGIEFESLIEDVSKNQETDTVYLLLLQNRKGSSLHNTD